MTATERAQRRALRRRFGYYVVFFSTLNAPVPIFHRMQSWDATETNRDDDGMVIESISRTGCGLIYRHWQGRGRSDFHELVSRDPFPAEHAVRFGQPCTRCWPA